MPSPAPEAPSYETIEFVKKGQITIPKKIRDAFHIEPGQKGMLFEVGRALLILPQPSKIPALLAEISDGLGTSGMSLEEMVLEMRRIRESGDYENQAWL